MSNQPREVLIEIVAKYGDLLLTSPNRCEGVLKDYCGEFRREIFVLVSCLRAGVVAQLRQQSGPAVKTVCVRLAQKIEQNLAISGDIAKWAMESWAIALGLLKPEEATTPASCPTFVAPPPAEQPAAAAAPEAPVVPETVVASVADIPLSESEPLPLEPGTPEFIAEVFESHWNVPDWSKPEGQVVVYPDGSGQKPSLRDAVRDAVANKRLILKPGVYKETLLIRRDLQIKGDGKPGEVILESSASAVLILDGACLMISGVTLKGVVGKDKKALAAVDVKSGHLVMEDCHLTSDSSNIMEVRGPQSEVVLRRCDFRDGKAGGINFVESGIGYLEECNFYQNKLSHISIGKDCAPTLYACKISNALMAGVYVNEGGLGLIENCDIWSNAVAGVQTRKGGNPRIRHSRISMNGRYGVLLAEDALGWYEDCQIFENAGVGVMIGKQSQANFSRCKIFDNKGEGVEADESAQVEFADCEIFDNHSQIVAGAKQSKR